MLPLFSGREPGGGGGLEPLHYLTWGADPPRKGMNVYSMKLFNNLIKNTLLTPIFCGLVKS